jgi:hypothetical protein
MPSGYCIYHQTSRSITLLSAHRILFVRFLRHTEFISLALDSTRLVYTRVTETECVHCAVRTESLNIIWVKFNLWRGAIAHTVSRRHSPRRLRIRSQARPCEIMWWAKWHWDKFFFEYCGFFQSLSLHLFPLTRSSTRCCYRKDKGRRLGAFQKAVLFGNRGAFDRKVLYAFFFFSVWRLTEILVARQTASTLVYINIPGWKRG